MVIHQLVSLAVYEYSHLLYPSSKQSSIMSYLYVMHGLTQPCVISYHGVLLGFNSNVDYMHNSAMKLNI